MAYCRGAHVALGSAWRAITRVVCHNAGMNFRYGMTAMLKHLRGPVFSSLAMVAMGAGSSAGAADPDKGAGQIVGLFMQACLPQHGDIQAVRSWLEDHKIPHMPDAGARVFLNDRSGIVYDASNASGRYGVAALDDGICEVFAETAKAADVISFLESSLKSQGLTVIRLKDYPEPRDTRLHQYMYLIVRDGTNYDLVASVSDAPHVIQAQLGFWRRGPNEALPVPLPPPR